jgi:hypothetical protein
MRLNSILALGEIWKSITFENISSRGIPTRKKQNLNWGAFRDTFLTFYEDQLPEFIRNNEHMKISNIFPENFDISLCRLTCPDPHPIASPAYLVTNGKRWMFFPPYGYKGTNQVIIRGIWFISQTNGKVKTITEDQHNLPYFIAKQKYYPERGCDWFITNVKQTARLPLNPFVVFRLLNTFIKMYCSSFDLQLPIVLVVLIFEYGLLIGPMDTNLIKITYDKSYQAPP